MNNEKLKKTFYRFLKNEGAFSIYKKNFIEQCEVRNKWCAESHMSVFKNKDALSFNNFISNINVKTGLVSWAFSWKDTKEGHEFWDNMSRKWRKLCLINNH